MRKFCAAVALSSLALLVASQAFAAANSVPYPNLVGSMFQFVGSPTFVDPTANPTGLMQETNDDGSNTALFGAPALSGNSLLFTPANFVAQATGGAIDTTGAQFQVVIESVLSTAVIDAVKITEIGDTALGFASTTGMTGTVTSMGGVLTITHTTAGALGVPISICFPGPAGGGCTAASGVTYTPAQFFVLGGTPLSSSWSAITYIDVKSIVPNATRAILSLDNDLSAFSEATTTAKIQKKVVNGPSVIIDVIPEPGTFALVCGGLLVMSVRARKNRA